MVLEHGVLRELLLLLLRLRPHIVARTLEQLQHRADRLDAARVLVHVAQQINEAGGELAVTLLIEVVAREERVAETLILVKRVAISESGVLLLLLLVHLKRRRGRRRRAAHRVNLVRADLGDNVRLTGRAVHADRLDADGPTGDGLEEPRLRSRGGGRRCARLRHTGGLAHKAGDRAALAEDHADEGAKLPQDLAHLAVRHEGLGQGADRLGAEVLLRGRHRLADGRGGNTVDDGRFLCRLLDVNVHLLEMLVAVLLVNNLAQILDHHLGILRDALALGIQRRVELGRLERRRRAVQHEVELGVVRQLAVLDGGRGAQSRLPLLFFRQVGHSHPKDKDRSREKSVRKVRASVSFLPCFMTPGSRHPCVMRR